MMPPFQRQTHDWAWPTTDDIANKHFPDAYYHANAAKRIKVYDHTLSTYTFYILGRTDIPTVNYQDLNFSGEIHLFISTDGAKLLKAWKEEKDTNAIKPYDISIYLEVNDGDSYSDTVMLLNVGKQAQKRTYDSSILGSINTKYELSTEQFEKLLAYSSEPGLLLQFLGGILQGAAGVVSYIPKQVSKGLKAINGFLDSKAKIKEHFWNPDHLQYKPKNNAQNTIEEISGLLSSTRLKLTGYANLDNTIVPDFVSRQVKSVLNVFDQFPEFMEKAQLLLQESDKMFTGLICGIWNALIDLLIGIIALVKLVLDAQVLNSHVQSDFVEDPIYYTNLFLEYTDNLLQALDNINWDEVLHKISTEFGQFIALIPARLEKFVKGLNNAQLGYYTGYIAFNIAEFFLPILKVAKAASAGKLPELFTETVQNIHQSAQGIVRSGKQIIGKSQKAAQQGLTKVLEIIDHFIGLLQEGTAGLKAFVEQVFLHLRQWLDDLMGLVRTEILIAGSRKLTTVTFLGIDVVARLLSRMYARKMAESGIKMIDAGEGSYKLFVNGKEVVSGQLDYIREWLLPYMKLSKRARKEALDDLNDLSRLTSISKGALQALLKMADEALNWQKGKRPNVCAVLEVSSGKTIFNYSVKQGLKSGEFPKDLHPLVEKWVEDMWELKESGRIRDLPDHHGKCAEVINISHWLKAIDPKGKMSIIEARRAFRNVTSHARKIGQVKKRGRTITEHFSFWEACESCNPLLKHFNIKEVY